MKNSDEYFLMLEPDEDDRVLTEGCLQDLEIRTAIKFLTRSSELFPFLEHNQRPKMIMMNSQSMPDDALALLQKLKSSLYASIPVVILSDMADNREVARFYEAGAISFIEKPSDYDLTRKKIKSFFEYWMSVAEV